MCNDCNSLFSLFTGTILEKTKWHWDIWIAVLNMTINSFSLKEMRSKLKYIPNKFLIYTKPSII